MSPVVLLLPLERLPLLQLLQPEEGCCETPLKGLLLVISLLELLRCSGKLLDELLLLLLLFPLLLFLLLLLLFVAELLLS